MKLKESTKFKIAVSSLRDKVNGKTPIKYVNISLTKRSCLSGLCICQRLGLGRADDILAKASAILELNGGTMEARTIVFTA
ncbi:hypothetical protein RRG08_019414 [Elysia crispata]|uniref:Uncharacterized protein n=1 Tax=Elysia crispata TaxID=231223 RepID=A0AAE0YTW0_9GAST|nr:hypothetical protein RRG08_019414 [Elysia crispata]